MFSAQKALSVIPASITLVGRCGEPAMTMPGPAMRLLTARQLQILKLAALGNSAKEIAIAIAIAPRTVECHLDKIRLILRARNQPHMVAIAMRTSIL